MYDTYTFFNDGPASCVTVTHIANDPSASIFVMAYGDFDPLNPATNYFGDGGGSGLPVSYSIEVPAFSSFDLVVFGAAGPGTYEFSVSGDFVSTATVSEPGSLALLALPLLALGLARRRPAGPLSVRI